MIKIFNDKNLMRLENYPKKIIKSIKELISLINENYGENRDVESELGGYVVVVENIVDIEILKQDKLQGLVAEYIDIIECSEGVNWTSSLFLLSSDFAIVVVTTEELSKFLLK